MGYCVTVIECKFSILSSNFDAALSAIKSLMSNEDKMSGGSFSGGKQIERWFSWVATEEVIHAKTLMEALWAWRWEPALDEAGNIEYLYFQGEKWGDDDKLFRAIAPFVKCGSYVAFRGEDGLMWRFLFEGGKIKEQTAEIVWR
jgi:hypothetical protein